MSKILLAGSAIILVLAVALALTAVITPTDNSMKQFSSEAELKSYLQSNTEGGRTYSAGTSEMQALSSAAKTGESTPSASQDYSKTNIQVEGVDEADIVKSDGKYIYAVSGKKVHIVDAYPANNAELIQTIEFNGSVRNIFINKDKLVVFEDYYNYIAYGSKSAGGEILGGPYYYSTPRSFIKIYDIADRKNPQLARNVSVDGNYYESRMIGNYVYFVANTPIYGTDPIPLPVVMTDGKETKIQASQVYYPPYPDNSYIFTNILAVNIEGSEEPTIKTYLLGYTQSMFVSTNNIYIVYPKRMNYYDYQTKLIERTIIPFMPQDVKAEIEKIQSSNISKYEKNYEISSVLNKYVQSLDPEEGAKLLKQMEEKAKEVMAELEKEMDKTIIHKIAVDKNNIDYKTNGEVPGQVLNQFSMDEYGNSFRIATTTQPFFFGGSVIMGTGTGSVAVAGSSGVAETSFSVPVKAMSVERSEPTTKNHLYVLNSDLKTVGKVEDLAPGERIYSVRFLGDRAYVVTFKQIDPLFVIDLKYPSDPKVLGYLKITGVSDYLHPYDENHIIGIGRDATEEGRIQGLKLALFDVSDVSNPKEMSKYVIGERGTHSEAIYDHKAFLFSKEKNLLVIPVSLTENNKYNVFQGAYVFNLDLSNGFQYKGRVSHTVEKNETDYWYYDYEHTVRRALYIADTLYTVSQKTIKMNVLTDLVEIGKIDLI